MSRAGLARHAARRDANEGDIIAALEERGFQVQKISGKGVFDLLCTAPTPPHRTFLVEVKGPKGTLTDAQVTFMDTWRGEKYLVRTVNDVELIPL